MARSLPDKYERFCTEYIKHLNAAKAYTAAGFAAKGASAGGHRLLGRKDVSERIQHLKQRAADRSEVKASRVIKAWWKISQTDYTKYFDEDNHQVLTVREMRERGLSTRMIKGFTYKRGAVEPVFKCPERAMENLAKHLGIYVPDKHEVAHVAQVVFQYPDNGRMPAHLMPDALKAKG